MDTSGSVYETIGHDKIPTSGSAKRHVRRRMTEQERIDYRRRRLLRACKECSASKRKCNHNHPDTKSITNTGIALKSPAEGSNDLIKKASGTPGCPALSDDEVQPQWPDVSYAPAENGNTCEILWPLDESESNVLVEGHLSSETALLLHKPQSPEALSAILFVENINCEGVSDAWFNGIPARLGYDACLDQAIAALQITCWYRRRLPGATLPKVYRALANALEALQQATYTDGSVPGDHTLAAVAALSPVEAIRTGHTFLVPSHVDGMVAIVVSRARLGPLSEFSRRILEYHFCDTYVMASLRGVVSPLEDIDWSYCEPCDLSRPIPERKIRAVGNRLCVRLPRLIALVRMACELQTNATAVSSALSLAEELMQLTNDAAESDYLRNVSIDKTIQPADRRVTTYSLQFKTVSSFEAATYYWHTRTTLLQICNRLRSFFPAMCDIYSLPSAVELEKELQRYASNILMTAQFARTLTARKRRRLFGQSLLACWSTFKQFPNVLPNARNPTEILAWLLEDFNTALLGQQRTITAQDMDDAAELFVGGPINGLYKSLYDPS